MLAGVLLCTVVFAGLGIGRAEEIKARGVSPTEIKLGQTAPLSGPLSLYATFSRATSAYFAMVNERGGIHGRKIKLVTLDDGFSPAKTVEQTRKLVESEGVFAMFA
ncbi:MAG: ABC transporter substrate-binding protein, partial [Proteobacteria bacterium]|nr:ABC transporter substrate-binding protein [Pseudomonadota bacterium]